MRARNEEEERRNGGIGRKARLFRNTIRQVRRRQQSEAAPAAPATRSTDGIKANEVEEMRRKLESAFGAVDTA